MYYNKITRKMKNFLQIFILLISFFGYSQSKNNEQRFSEAIQMYNSGDFQGAVNNYQTILKSGWESSSLYYNLANSHYKLNNIPESIYYYEKALLLNPENEDAKNNLVFANQMTIDAITPLPKTWLKQISDNITRLFSPKTWIFFPILGIFGFVASFLLYYFAEKTILKRIFFSITLVCLIFSIGTYFIADFHQKNIQTEKFAILFDKTIRVFSEPNKHSAEIFTLHEGTKVEIIENLDNWFKIKLADGKTGWVKQEVLKIL